MNSLQPAATTEYAHTTEAAAKRQRREFITQGRLVSLIGYDTNRDLYAFDVAQDAKAAA